MKRQERKNSRLQARIAELERELRHVESNIDQLDEAVNTPDRESALRRLRKVADRQERRDEAGPRAPSKPEPAPVFAPPAAPPEPTVPAGPADAPDGLIPRSAPDRRFASYFVTGSLQSVRPLRTERRTQRNRAIFMLFFAAVLLYWVITMLTRR